MNECRDCVEQPLMADGTPLSLFVCVCVSLGCTVRLSRRNLNAQREYSTASEKQKLGYPSHQLRAALTGSHGLSQHFPAIKNRGESRFLR